LPFGENNSRPESPPYHGGEENGQLTYPIMVTRERQWAIKSRLLFSVSLVILFTQLLSICKEPGYTTPGNGT